MWKNRVAPLEGFSLHDRGDVDARWPVDSFSGTEVFDDVPGLYARVCFAIRKWAPPQGDSTAYC